MISARLLACWSHCHGVRTFQILEMNGDLCFELQRQQLIEMIRKGDVEGAVRFAQEDLAPRAEDNVLCCFPHHFVRIHDPNVVLLFFFRLSYSPNSSRMWSAP